MEDLHYKKNTVLVLTTEEVKAVSGGRCRHLFHHFFDFRFIPRL